MLASQLHRVARVTTDGLAAERDRVACLQGAGGVVIDVDVADDEARAAFEAILALPTEAPLAAVL